jgi:hypothetical protein
MVLVLLEKLMPHARVITRVIGFAAVAAAAVLILR